VTANPVDTPTATPEPSATPGGSCAGDCDMDGRVGIDELIRGVSIALGSFSLARCPRWTSTRTASLDQRAGCRSQQRASSVRMKLLNC
jgi:hypothetical protein